MSNEKQQIVFPNVTGYLYAGLGTLANVQREYNKEVKRAAEQLRGDRLVPTYLDFYYSKLENYRTKYYNFNSLAELEKEIIELKQFLFQLRIPCSISGRLKNYIAFIEKVRTFIYDGLDLYSINDELGFRIIVGSEAFDSEDTIKQLYDVANNVISFFVINKGYQLVLPSPPNELGFRPQQYSKIYVPKHSLIYPEYSRYVKDYFVKPKKRGYQALHMVFLNRQGLTIEVQIRSFASHYHAKFIATHELHKDERYTNHPDLTQAEQQKLEVVKVQYDPEKVCLKSYYSKNGNTLDLIGLSETIRDPFNNFFIG